MLTLILAALSLTLNIYLIINKASKRVVYVNNVVFAMKLVELGEKLAECKNRLDELENVEQKEIQEDRMRG